VRGLLITRFETNSIIHDRLIKHVGQEALGGQQGGAVNVYNHSQVSANANPVRAPRAPSAWLP